MSLLECRGVSISFGGVRALSDVDIAADEATITGLIGPNGAGKTTLFNCITGLLEPNSGTIRLDGTEMNGLAPFKRARLGVARTFQRLELFTSLSVRDNIRVAGEIRNRWHKGRINVAEETERVLDQLHIAGYADRMVAEIPTGMARRVEMGRALMTHPRVLLLDEPASGQDEQETVEFGELLLELAASGTGILLVEHDVGLVMRVCSHIQVLDFGKIIATGTPEQIRQSADVIEAYLGADHTT
jgi:branched-chain amino acid transport system ATP-binding protein